jgi:DNA-3-methyladenine glycosylase I
MARFEQVRVRGWCPLEGLPADSDDEHFEALAAAVFQARFRPEIVRARWPSIRAAFADFRLQVVASWPDEATRSLLGAPGMIRNEKKITATLRNARALARLSARAGGVRAYLDAFAPDTESLVDEIDRWASYVGAPSIRWFLGCVGVPARWRGLPSTARQFEIGPADSPETRH